MLFDYTSYLGIDYREKIKVGEVYTFQQGATYNVTIYNAAEKGPISFLISFSYGVVTAVSVSIFALSTYLLAL